MQYTTRDYEHSLAYRTRERGKCYVDVLSSNFHALSWVSNMVAVDTRTCKEVMVTVSNNTLGLDTRATKYS